MAGKIPGPEPMLEDKELLRQIKESILSGNDLKTTANICGMPESTLYTYHSDNYLNIADKIEGWKRDRKLLLADNNIEGILCLGISDKDSLKVVADMSKFVKETLDKKNYSKSINTDLTSGGKPISINIDKDIAEKNVINSESKDNS
jgi:hypothetical protein